MIGHATSTFAGQTETTHWLGKPWRRLELLVTDTFYKGERVDRTYHASAHLGLRRLGWAFTASVTRQRPLDYSEEPNQ